MRDTRREALSRWLRPIAILVLASALAGCALIPWAPRTLAVCPGVLRSVDEIDGEFVLRLRVRVRSGELDFPMRLIVQKTADELVAIGFSPIGAKLFTIRQRGSETEVDALPPAVLPVPPLNVLRDLHRVRFLSAPRPESGDGASSRLFESTVVTDHWQSGSLVRRELTASDRRVPTTLSFESDSTVVTIDQARCGYSAEWTTLSEDSIR